MVPLAARGQGGTGPGFVPIPPRYVFDDLPTCGAPSNGSIVSVTDAADSGACDAGGGTSTSLCQCRQTSLGVYGYESTGGGEVSSFGEGDSSCSIEDAGSGSLTCSIDGATMISSTSTVVGLAGGLIQATPLGIAQVAVGDALVNVEDGSVTMTGDGEHVLTMDGDPTRITGSLSIDKGASEAGGYEFAVSETLYARIYGQADESLRIETISGQGDEISLRPQQVEMVLLDGSADLFRVTPDGTNVGIYATPSQVLLNTGTSPGANWGLFARGPANGLFELESSAGDAYLILDAGGASSDARVQLRSGNTVRAEFRSIGNVAGAEFVSGSTRVGGYDSAGDWDFDGDLALPTTSQIDNSGTATIRFASTGRLSLDSGNTQFLTSIRSTGVQSTTLGDTSADYLTINGDGFNLVGLDCSAGDQYVTTTAGGVLVCGDDDDSGGGGGSPAGSGTELQYRDGSSFGAVTDSAVSGSSVSFTGTISTTSLMYATGGSADGAAYGLNAICGGADCSVFGDSASAGTGAAAFGNLADCSNPGVIQAVCVGNRTEAHDDKAVAVGYGAEAGLRAAALGPNTEAVHDYSVGIGYNADTTADYQIMLGDATDSFNEMVVNGRSLRLSFSTAVLSLDDGAGGAADLSVVGVVSIGDIGKIVPKETAPGTCEAATDLYTDTSGALCYCTSTDTWTNVSGVGSCT